MSNQNFTAKHIKTIKNSTFFQVNWQLCNNNNNKNSNSKRNSNSNNNNEKNKKNTDRG